jgi:hypothetical protein
MDEIADAVILAMIDAADSGDDPASVLDALGDDDELYRLEAAFDATINEANNHAG